MSQSPSSPMPPRRSATMPIVGIIGGGQLAKMLIQAASRFACPTVVLTRDPDCAAAPLATHVLQGDWDAPQALLELAQQVDFITLENEFVEAEGLAALEENGFAVRPSSETVRLVQDKWRQKETLREAGLPVPRFQPIQSVDEAATLDRKLGTPWIMKARRNAYDGKGNTWVESPTVVPDRWQELAGDTSPLMAEEKVGFERELAVMVTRSVGGSTRVYPVVETVQRDHICHVVKAPAPIDPEIADRAAAVARQAVEAVGGVGTIGVELFLTSQGDILINELAPRVHNSGHYTIEGCVCSQFENHLRAILGWPLGAAEMSSDAAAMVNLLGEGEGPGSPLGLPQALQAGRAHIHIYGKSRSRPGRKMGHVTALGATVSEALDEAQTAAGELRFGPLPDSPKPHASTQPASP